MAVGEAQLIDLPGRAGHMINMEQPAAVNDLLTRFLARLPVPAADGLTGQAEGPAGLGDEPWSR